MTRYADLEIVFRKHDERPYGLTFRFNGPEDAAEQRSPTEPMIVLDFSTLTGNDPKAYSDALSAAFFTADASKEFTRFRTEATAQNATLSVRLSIDASAPELHPG